MVKLDELGLGLGWRLGCELGPVEEEEEEDCEIEEDNNDDRMTYIALLLEERAILVPRCLGHSWTGFVSRTLSLPSSG